MGTKQHTVPASFLKNWAATDEGRNSKISLHGIDLSNVRISVENVCHQRDFYTSDREKDNIISPIEGGFISIINRYNAMAACEIMEGPELLLDIFYVAHLFLRGGGFINYTEKERIDLIDEWMVDFLRSVFMDGNAGGNDLQEIGHSLIQAAKSNWCVKIMEVRGDELLIGDDPVLSIIGASDHVAFILPISPNRAMIIFDVRRIELVSNIIEAEVCALMNGMTAAKAQRFVYSRNRLTEEECATAAKVIGKYTMTCEYENGKIKTMDFSADEIDRLRIWRRRT